MTAMGNAEPATTNEFIQSLPKAELHLHLEGTVGPDTLAELAGNHGQPLSPEACRAFYDYTDFTGFLRCFRAISSYLETPDDYELAAYRMVQRLAEDNVKHAEVYISVGVCDFWGRDFQEIFLSLERARERGERDFGVSLLWIFDAVRQFGAEKAMCVAEKAVELNRFGSIAGFGIGGDERIAGPELFCEVYAYAADHGLRLTCHAGETVGPESVWTAIRRLKAERIGHGLSCREDPHLLKFLAAEQIPMEVAVTSNYRTACIDAIASHPLREFLNQGLLVTLNSDDPGIFQTSIGREYEIARDVFGCDEAELRQLARNSFAASFLPEAKKNELLQLFTPESRAGIPR